MAVTETRFLPVFLCVFCFGSVSVVGVLHISYSNGVHD